MDEKVGITSEDLAMELVSIFNPAIGYESRF